MEFVKSITEYEQKLFVSLFIYHYKDIEKKLASRDILLKYISDMTKDPTQNMSGESLDQILREFIEKEYIKPQEVGEKICYKILEEGENLLKEENLSLPQIESILPRYISQRELREMVDLLAEALNVQVGIMDENRAFLRFSSRDPEGLCDEYIRNESYVSCKCFDLLAVRRAKQIGAHIYKCHAGFVECIAPIKFEDEQRGYVFLGRITPKDLNIERFAQYCECRGKKCEDIEEFKSIVKNYVEEKGKTEEEIRPIGDFTASIGILLSSYVKELNNYGNKINKIANVIEAGADISGRDIEFVLHRIMLLAKALFSYDGATIWELGPTKEKLVPRISENGLPTFAKDPFFDMNGEGFVSCIAREKRPLLISDVSSHIARNEEPKPKYKDYIQGKELGSFLGVPLIVDDRLIGVLEIEKHGTGQFTIMDQVLLTAIARMAGIVIKRYTLLEVLTNISRQDNLKDLLEISVSEMPAIVGAVYCSIFLFNSDRKQLVLRATNAPNLEEEVGIAYYDGEKRKGRTWNVAQDGKTIMVNNDDGKGLIREFESAYYLGCAIKDKPTGKPHGTIRFVERDGQSPFKGRDKEIAEILATWLSLAIDREQLASAREHDRLLLKISEIQNTSTTIEEMLDRIASEIAQAFKCHACEIALAIENGSIRLEVKGVYTINGNSKGRKTISYGIGEQSFTAEIARRREILNLADIADHYYPDPVPEKSLGPGPRLGVPLLVGDELVGVLKLGDKETTPDNPAGLFFQDDVATAEIIAGNIAGTIKTQQQREGVAILLSEIDRRYMEDRDAESALKYMVENLGKAINGCWGSMYRHDTGENTFVRIAFSRPKNTPGNPPEKTLGGHIPMVLAKKSPQHILEVLNSPEHQKLLNENTSEEVGEYIKSIGAEYALPLMVVDRVYGVFCFYKADKNGFTIQEMLSAKELAARASVLLESHELLDARTKLYDASSRLQKSLQLNELLKEIVESIIQIGYDRARLYLISEDGRHLHSRTQRGLKNPDNIKKFESGEIGGDLSQGKLDTQSLGLDKPVLFVKPGSDSEESINQRDTKGIVVDLLSKLGYEGELEREGVNEWIDFPLVVSGRQLGKITVDNKWSRRPFSRIDCEVLGLFGQYAAQAILNSLEIERTFGFGFGARALAHNIKGRAAAISMTLESIEKNISPDDADLARRIANIRKANDAILRHIEAMRKAVKLEQTVTDMFTIRELKNFVWIELQDAYNARAENFICDFPERILDKKVEVDLGQIIEVFLNLMRNSLEATAGAAKITVLIWVGNGDVYASWEDNGPGIPEKDINDLFKIGFTTKIGGTGTGLYSIRQMLLNNGGNIWFDGANSEKNDKSNYVARFVIKIPLIGSSPDNSAKPSQNEGGDEHEIS